jgi:hypothetical protein
MLAGMAKQTSMREKPDIDNAFRGSQLSLTYLEKNVTLSPFRTRPAIIIAPTKVGGKPKTTVR